MELSRKYNLRVELRTSVRPCVVGNGRTTMVQTARMFGIARDQRASTRCFQQGFQQNL